jgi:hypothetical protein
MSPSPRNPRIKSGEGEGSREHSTPAVAAADHAKIDLADHLGSAQLCGFGRGLAPSPADKSSNRKILTEILSTSQKAWVLKGL